MKIDATLDRQAFLGRIQGRLRRVQFELDSRVAFDSNKYCPMDTGQLQGSVYPVEGNGVLEWSMPYARRQYYDLPDKSLDSNPMATTKWFEAAKANYLKDWEKLIDEVYNN